MALGLIVTGTAGLLWWLGVPRLLWSFTGAALMLGAAGYALQGQPDVPASPVKAQTRAIDVDPALVQLREAMLGRFSSDGAYMIAADALLRAGQTRSAVRVVLGGLNAYPKSVTLWTGLGSTLAIHDGSLSPASLLAFQRAATLAPNHPAPPLFLGLAHVRAGEFAQARRYWARALALTPRDMSYRPQIAQRLALLDRYLALTGQNGGVNP